MAAHGEYALECRGVTVNYGNVTALNGVTVAFERGRIHAVVGQNGAGKTTFGRVCAGIVKPDAGRLIIEGRDVPIGKVRRSRALGVELIHQNFALPPSFTIVEVMEFGSKRSPASIYSRSTLRDRWAGHLRALGIKVDPEARIRNLPVEVQQGVEIARALVNDAKVLILDEPTAVLSPAGIETLFERIRVLGESGVTVILILHKLREVLGIADTITVLRDGRLVEGPVPSNTRTADQLAASIIGSSTPGGDTASTGDRAAILGLAAAAGHAPSPGVAPTAPALEVEKIVTRPDPDGPALEGVSFRIGRGEILGVAGIEGNGQRTLVKSLAGLIPLAQGSIRLAGEEMSALSLASRRAAGLRIVPFERNSEGLSLSSALWENWSARQLLLGRAWRMIAPAQFRRMSREALTRWDVRFASVDQPASSLSGGNAQKLILSREIDEDARLIIAAQPTRGLDVGATTFVWRALREARVRGCGILLISSDLDELLDISDRVVVMVSGRIAGEFAPPYKLAAVGAAMTAASP